MSYVLYTVFLKYNKLEWIKCYEGSNNEVKIHL